MKNAYIIKITCESPLHHGSFGGGTGNASLVRRTRRVDIPGMPEVPVVSGNAIRGVVRRAIFRDLFERTGVRDRLKDKRWDKLYAALANGGHLSGSEKRIDPDGIRNLRTSLPPLSVLGAALYTYMLPGHVTVGIAWPDCAETGHSETPAEDLIEEVALVRHVDVAHQDPKVTGVTAMPMTFEAFSTGTILRSVLQFASHATPQEVGAIAYGLDKVMVLGGKGGSGHGRVRIEHDLDPAPYIEWLAGGTAADALAALAGTL